MNKHLNIRKTWTIINCLINKTYPCNLNVSNWKTEQCIHKINKEQIPICINMKSTSFQLKNNIQHSNSKLLPEVTYDSIFTQHTFVNP